MRANLQTSVNSRFVDRAPYWALLCTGAVIGAFLAAPFFTKPLVLKTLQVSPDEGDVSLPPLQLQPQSIGALRIDVKAVIPSNRWLTYEIQLRDAQGNVIASGIKQAWAESGTWYEEGESGSWAEDDLLAGLDVRPRRSEPVTIALQVLDYSDTAGNDLNESIAFDVWVADRVVDIRYLWAGLFGTVTLTVLAFVATPLSGRQVVYQRVNGSEVSERAELGGAKRLVRVILKVKAGSFAPSELKVSLTIKDGNGAVIDRQTSSIQMHYHKNKEGQVTYTSGSLHRFFVLEPLSSYGFYAEVNPKQPSHSTTLIVRDGTRTRHAVEVTQLQGKP